MKGKGRKDKDQVYYLNKKHILKTESSEVTLKPVSFKTIYKNQTLLSKSPFKKPGGKLVSTSLIANQIVKPTQSIQLN